MNQLPIIPLVHFTIEHPGFNGGSITMKPFTVGQEAVLLQIKDSKDVKQITKAVTQIAKECTVDADNHDFDKIPFYLIELMFLRLRQHSNGEIVDLNFRCKEPTGEEGKACENLMQVQIDLREVGLQTPGEYKEAFTLYDNGENSIGVEFKQPSIATVDEEGDFVESLTPLVHKIWQGEEVWEGAKLQKKEVEAFLRGIPTKKKKEIVDCFLTNGPRVKHLIERKCEKCGKVHKIELEGLEDFFG